MLQNIVITLALLVLAPAVLLGQTNLVPNASFEQKDISSQPDAAGQVDGAEDWKPFNTSDWISDLPNFFNVNFNNVPNFDGDTPAAGMTKMMAHSGNYFLGMGSCEGAQVKLTDAVEEMHWVTVSFWFSPRGKTDTEIHSYLMQDEDEDGINSCTTPNIPSEVDFVCPINADGLDAIHVPGTWYFYQSEPQLVTGAEFEWFAMKGRHVSGAFQSPEYFFIDDVTVSTFEYCEHFCIPHGNATLIHPPGGIQNSMIGNSSNLNFFATFQNADEVIFRVFTPDAGCMIYEWYSYDVNGLLDVGFTDFAVSWNGNTNIVSSCHTNTSDVPFPDVYVITLEAKSCSGSDFTHTGTITVLDIVSPPAQQYPETQNKVLGDCCPYDAYFQNQTFSSSYREDVDHNIYAGSNVTTGPNGPVVVQAGVTLKFFAGNDIILDPGFIVNSGGHYVGTIGPCGANPLRQGVNTIRQEIEEARKSNPNSNMIVLDEILVSPNPSAGFFNVEFKNFNTAAIQSIEVVSTTGAIERTMQGDGFGNNLILDLSSSASGIYVMKVTLKSGKVYSKRVVKE